MKAMPVALEIHEPFVRPPHKRWTRDECATLEQAGLIDARRYELIDGELIQKMGKNHPHMLAVLLLGTWLRRTFGETFVVQEPSIDLRPEDTPTSDPEPDLIVLNRSFLEFTSKAKPDDIRLAVEVSSATLSFDLTAKARLYARAKIAEYWVVDLQGRRLIVHRDPAGDAFQLVIAYGEHEQVAPLAAPSSQLGVDEILKY